MRSLPFRFILAAIPIVLSLSSATAADSACKFIGEANAKIYSLPTHMYQTETATGKTRTSELIYLNNKTYIMVGGKWITSKATPASMAEMQKEAQKDETGMSCSAVRDEAVNGEAATLYSAHRQTPDGKTDSQIWVSKSRGVPVKLEMDMDTGGSNGKSHRSIRYEYTKVTVPAGVQ